MYLRCKDLEVFEQRSSLLLKMRHINTPDPTTPVGLKIPSMFDDHAVMVPEKIPSMCDDHAIMVPEMFSAGV